MPSNRLAERILSFVEAKGYRPQRIHELAEAMGVGDAEHGDFHAACRALMKTGRVVLGAKNALMLPAPPGRITGTYRGNQRGFGFIIPDTPNAHGDLFVPPGQSGGAVTGDTVTARVLRRGKRGGRMLHEGRVEEIVRRGQNHFVGELVRQAKRWFVIPDGNTLHVPIAVGDPGAKRGREGDQVVVEIVQFPQEGVEARGVIVKVLGRRGEPGVDTLSIIEQYQLPGEFPDGVVKEAHRAAAGYDAAKEAKKREDLRKLTIITIDPVEARDFDDAISLTRLKNGRVELGVHIADVSHFVRAGSALDDEARQRSNSVYLPGRVIPMLPEALSNEVCSLQEKQPRLAKSAFITFDRSGNVKHARVANSVIQSGRRLTYEQAAEILGGKRGRASAKVVALLKDMEKLARAIRQRRLRAGMLELDLPEVEPVFDEDGNVADVAPADQSFPHKIIEMFMVEANEAVARLLTGCKAPFLRRTHGAPRRIASGELQQFLKVLGHDLPANADRFALQKLLDDVRGGSDAFAVHLAILRSMQQAEYSPAVLGHYALASEHYCHFTSPIRRYPDLTIHRLIDAYLEGRLSKRGQPRGVPDADELARLGAQCSANERRAESAERELMLVLTLRLIEQHIGEPFDGVVTGVANVGVFVQLDRYLVDGLVKFNNLPDDWWELDPSKGCVVGQRSGRQITVGDRLKVTISRVHITTRSLEVALAQKITTRARPGPSARRMSKTSKRSSQPLDGSKRSKRGSASRPGKRRRG